MTYNKSMAPGEDLIDLRIVIERFEDLELENDRSEDDTEEMVSLKALLDACEGNGGDEKWRGAWYPVTLIHESYFETYARELAEDIGAINSEATWPNNFIDWEAATDALKGDYTVIEWQGETYYTR